MTKILIAIVLVLAMLSYFSTNIISFIKLKDKEEQIKVVPIERSIQQRENKNLETSTITGENIIITTPWGDLLQQGIEKEVELYKFDGVNMVIYKNITTPLTQIKESGNKDVMNMYNKYFSQQIVNDPYLFRKSILNVTYDDIKIYNTRSRGLFLLSSIKIKGKFPYYSYIYSFKTDKIRGFQSDLSSETGVELNFFDNNNKYYRIFLNGEYTQDDIDYIINNINILNNN